MLSRCPHCGVGVNTKRLSKHMASKCRKSPQPCPHCGILVSLGKINKHISSKCPAIEKPCPYCCCPVAPRYLRQHLAVCQKVSKSSAKILPVSLTEKLLQPVLVRECQIASEIASKKHRTRRSGNICRYCDSPSLPGSDVCYNCNLK
jgi:hypothetical protein